MVRVTLRKELLHIVGQEDSWAYSLHDDGHEAVVGSAPVHTELTTVAEVTSGESIKKDAEHWAKPALSHMQNRPMLCACMRSCWLAA
eukprot:921339-Pelagomonas_calceolata.AAC.11